jgi:hypothetical protein
MNIFKITYPGGEIDWVLAENKHEARSLLDNTFDKSCDVIEKLSEKEEKESYLLDLSEYLDDVPEEQEDQYFNGYKIIMNMLEFKEKNKMSQFIASSEF